MPYLGKEPARVPVTAADIPDNSITAAKIIDGAITIADIANDAVTEDKLANSINSAITANTAKTTNATHTGEVTGGTTLTITDDAVTADKLANSINSAIAANTAKTGITSGQASAITANTAKVTNSTSASDLASGTLPMARLSGTLPALNGSALTNLPASGKVLQVLETIWNTDVTFPQNQNFVSIGTGLTITPTASSSKILVLYTYSITAVAGNYSCVHGKLVRDSTNIAENWYMGYVNNEQFHRLQSWSFTYLDSPNTTSSIVYNLTGANGTGSSFSGTYGGGFNVSGLTSRMTLIEIGA